MGPKYLLFYLIGSEVLQHNDLTIFSINRKYALEFGIVSIQIRHHKRFFPNCEKISTFYRCLLQGQLQIWTEHSHTDLWNLSYLNPKGEDSSCKIDGFMATYIPNLRWAWQAQFLSHTLLISKIKTTFKDIQMILILFFDFSNGFRFSKISGVFPPF